jgi:hypothetical protein
MLQVFEALMEAGEIFEALEKGVENVIEIVAEVADSYLQVQIPAYGAAVSACAAVPSCTDAVIDLRNRLAIDFAKATGLWHIIKAIRDLWMKLPAAVREIAAKAGELLAEAKEMWDTAMGTLKDVFTDPEAAWHAVKAGLAPKNWLSFEYGKDAVAFLEDIWSASGLETIMGKIEDIPVLGPVVAGFNDIAMGAIDFITDPVGTLKNWFNFGGPDCVYFAGKCWTDFTEAEKIGILAAWEPEGGYFGPYSNPDLYFRDYYFRNPITQQYTHYVLPGPVSLIIAIATHESTGNLASYKSAEIASHPDRGAVRAGRPEFFKFYNAQDSQNIWASISSTLQQLAA